MSFPFTALSSRIRFPARLRMKTWCAATAIATGISSRYFGACRILSSRPLEELNSVTVLLEAFATQTAELSTATASDSSSWNLGPPTSRSSRPLTTENSSTERDPVLATHRCPALAASADGTDTCTCNGAFAAASDAVARTPTSTAATDRHARRTSDRGRTMTCNRRAQ